MKMNKTEEKPNQYENINFPPQLKRILYAAIISFTVVLVIYFYHFHGKPGDAEQFAFFGDFLGGALNPTLTFLTVFLLIWSIRVQMHELELTRNEMEMTRDELKNSSEALNSSQQAQNLSYQLQLKEVKRKQLSESLSEQYRLLDEIWDKNLFELGNAGFITFNDIFDRGRHLNTGKVRAVTTNLAEMLDTNSEAYEDSHIAGYLRELQLIVCTISQFTSEMYNLTFLDSISVALFTKAKRINKKFLRLGILDQALYDKNIELIEIPKRNTLGI